NFPFSSYLASQKPLKGWRQTYSGYLISSFRNNTFSSPPKPTIESITNVSKYYNHYPCHYCAKILTHYFLSISLKGFRVIMTTVTIFKIFHGFFVFTFH